MGIEVIKFSFLDVIKWERGGIDIGGGSYNVFYSLEINLEVYYSKVI